MTPCQLARLPQGVYQLAKKIAISAVILSAITTTCASLLRMNYWGVCRHQLPKTVDKTSESKRGVLSRRYNGRQKVVSTSSLLAERLVCHIFRRNLAFHTGHAVYPMDSSSNKFCLLVIGSALQHAPSSDCLHTTSLICARIVA